MNMLTLEGVSRNKVLPLGSLLLYILLAWLVSCLARESYSSREEGEDVPFLILRKLSFNFKVLLESLVNGKHLHCSFSYFVFLFPFFF